MLFEQTKAKRNEVNPEDLEPSDWFTVGTTDEPRLMLGERKYAAMDGSINLIANLGESAVFHRIDGLMRWHKDHT